MIVKTVHGMPRDDELYIVRLVLTWGCEVLTCLWGMGV
jgi:hypothetical protein